MKLSSVALLAVIGCAAASKPQLSVSLVDIVEDMPISLHLSHFTPNSCVR